MAKKKPIKKVPPKPVSKPAPRPVAKKQAPKPAQRPVAKKPAPKPAPRPAARKPPPRKPAPKPAPKARPKPVAKPRPVARKVPPKPAPRRTAPKKPAVSSPVTSAPSAAAPSAAAPSYAAVTSPTYAGSTPAGGAALAAAAVSPSVARGASGQLDQQGLIKAFEDLDAKYSSEKSRLSPANSDIVAGALHGWHDFYYDTNNEAPLSEDDLVYWNNFYSKTAQLMLSAEPKAVKARAKAKKATVAKKLVKAVKAKKPSAGATGIQVSQARPVLGPFVVSKGGSPASMPVLIGVGILVIAVSMSVSHPTKIYPAHWFG